MAYSSSTTKFFTSGQISFSQMATNFAGGATDIKASAYFRYTDTSIANPILPDCTENQAAGVPGATLNSNLSGLNWKTSKLRNTIKYYNVTQSGTDGNSLITNDSTGTWNGNLGKNILKNTFLNGTLYSNDPTLSAATVAGYVYNLTLTISGAIYGAAGKSNSGTGGNALNITSTTGSSSVKIYLNSSAQVYGGGGGGSHGSTGATGYASQCTQYTTTQGCKGSPGCPAGFTDIGTRGGNCCQTTCQWCGWDTCGCFPCVGYTEYRDCSRVYAVPGAPGGTGGAGGTGRGYNNFSGSLAGAPGAPGTAGGCPTYGGSGSQGNTGANGGEWGQSGMSDLTNGGASGRSVSGANYSITGSINSNTLKGAY